MKHMQREYFMNKFGKCVKVADFKGCTIMHMILLCQLIQCCVLVIP